MKIKRIRHLKKKLKVYGLCHQVSFTFGGARGSGRYETILIVDAWNPDLLILEIYQQVTILIVDAWNPGLLILEIYQQETILIVDAWNPGLLILEIYEQVR